MSVKLFSFRTKAGSLFTVLSSSVSVIKEAGDDDDRTVSVHTGQGILESSEPYSDLVARWAEALKSD